MVRLATVAFCVLVAATPGLAQSPNFGYPLPPPDSIAVTRDVVYGTSGGTALQLDVYAPKASGTRAPALIFSNIATGANRGNPFYASWAQVAASRGLVAILPDLRRESYAQDMDALLAYLPTKGAAHGIDPTAISMYAGSGNVSFAFPYVEKVSQAIVKSAVMYYGAARSRSSAAIFPCCSCAQGWTAPT